MCVCCVLTGYDASAKKNKPLRNIPTDTIVIPEDIIFDVMSSEIENESQYSATFDINMSIMGETMLDVDQMYLFVKSQNKDFSQRDSRSVSPYRLGLRHTGRHSPLPVHT